MTRSCEQCGNGFAAVREHARFCSPRCRVAWHRAHELPAREDSIIRVSTCALVISQPGTFWLMRRTTACRDEHGRWDTCAGRLEDGMTAEENMRRELLEELGVTPLALEFIGYRDVFRDGADSPHYIGLDFLATVQAQDVACREPHKHDQGGWFTRDTLPSPLHSQIPVWLGKYSQHIG